MAVRQAMGRRFAAGVAGLMLLLMLAPPGLAAAADDAPPPAAYPTTEFAQGAREAAITASGLMAKIVYQRRPQIDRDNDVPVLQVSTPRGLALEVAGVASGMEMPAATASIAKIDPYRDGAQVYFSSYSGGAHCCSRILVAEPGPKGWVAVPVGSFDGDGDYLEDVDGDGIAEIVAHDDAFLYAFDCYACSAAPLRILAIRDGKAVDVSAEPRFRKAHRDWLAELEADADPATRWSSPGFLAGWVAANIRAGSGAAAWQALSNHWNLAADSGEEACLSGDDLDRCPKSDLRMLKFPDRLKLFLARNGYAL